MSKLVIRPLAKPSAFLKAVLESKAKVEVDQAELVKKIKYGEYGTTMIKPNPYKLIDRPDHKLKGVIGGIRMYQIISRLELPNATVYTCPYFTMQYYPPEHFLALAKKSSPAIHFQYKEAYLLNANLRNGKSIEENIKILRSKAFGRMSNIWKKMILNSGSLVPKQWAYFRVNARKFIRPIFYRTWLDSKAPDGLYLFKVDIFPDKENQETYRLHVIKAIGTVARMNMNEFVLSNNKSNWVEAVNARVKTQSLNAILQAEMAPFRYERTN